MRLKRTITCGFATACALASASPAMAADACIVSKLALLFGRNDPVRFETHRIPALDGGTCEKRQTYRLPSYKPGHAFTKADVKDVSYKCIIPVAASGSPRSIALALLSDMQKCDEMQGYPKIVSSDIFVDLKGQPPAQVYIGHSHEKMIVEFTLTITFATA